MGNEIAVCALLAAGTLAGELSGKQQFILSTTPELKPRAAQSRAPGHAGCYKPDLGVDAMYFIQLP